MENRVNKTATAPDALGAYFHDMAEHDVLAPEDELRLARRIEALDIEVWTQMLSYAPTVDYVVSLVESCLENSLKEFRTLRAAADAAKKARSKLARERLEDTAREVAAQLRALDMDRQYRDIVRAELARLAAGGTASEAVAAGRLPFSPRAAAFARHVQRIEASERAAARAREEFISANLRLVVSVARRYHQGALALADLIQEGNLGLMKAVDRFDYRRGFRFSTYATWWIRHTVGRALANKGNAVRVPVHLSDTAQRVGRARRTLAAKLGREPTAAELASEAGLTEERLAHLEQQLPKLAVSLDQALGDDDGQSRLEVFQDPGADERTPFDAVSERADALRIVALMEHLKPVEADVIRQRFGLGDADEKTLQEIADQYGLSRERIRQIQQDALGKLRRALQRSEVPTT